MLFIISQKPQYQGLLDENILNSKALEYGLRGRSYPDVKNALSAAKDAASSDDMIFIGGSTFIVGDVLAKKK